MDPMGREAWEQLGVDADESKATVSVSAVKDDQHRTPYRPTVDGITGELVYISHPAVLVTAHDCIRIHDFVRKLQQQTPG